MDKKKYNELVDLTVLTDNMKNDYKKKYNELVELTVLTDNMRNEINEYEKKEKI